MINLLPSEQKKELLLKKTNRLVVVLGIIFLTFLVCFILILFSLKFYLLIDIFAQKEQIISKEDLSKLDKTKDEIKGYNTKISNLKDFYSNQIYYGEMIEAILKINIPNGVKIIYISSEKSGSNIKTTIYGFSDLRENLILFKNNIENDSIIKNPYFPPESWTKISNINFYLTFDYENQK